MNELAMAYKRAKRTLGTMSPRRHAALVAIHAAREVAYKEAVTELRKDLAAGADPRELYDKEPTGTARKLALLGLLRRGPKAWAAY